MNELTPVNTNRRKIRVDDECSDEIYTPLSWTKLLTPKGSYNVISYANDVLIAEPDDHLQWSYKFCMETKKYDTEISTEKESR